MSALPRLISLLVLSTGLLAQIEMLRPVPQPGQKSRSAITSSTDRTRYVALETSRLRQLLDERSSNELMRFSLFPDLVIDVSFQRIYRTNAGTTAVFSGTAEDQSAVTIALTNGHAVGHFTTSTGRRIEIVSEDRSTAVIRELTGNSSPGECGAKSFELPEGSQLKEPPDARRANGAEDNGRTIDVLVIYSHAAASWGGGDFGIQNRMAVLNEAANQSLDNSDIDLQFRLVRVMRVDFYETPTLLNDLQVMSNHPFTDQLRAEHRADIVHLVTNSSDSWCGFGVILDPSRLNSNPASAGFSVSTLRCLEPGNPTYAHEIGHNMGLHHDPVTRAGQGVPPSMIFPFSQGYQQTARAPWFFDIMAYQCAGCRPIPNWANPYRFVDGVPTGIENLFDSALHLSLIKKTVANYRVSGRETALPMLARLTRPSSGAHLQPGQTTFEWEPASSGIYRLLIGVTGPGSGDVFQSYRLGRPSLTIPLPVINSRVNVTLQTWTGRAWESNHYTFQAGDPGPNIEFNASDVLNCANRVSRLSWNAPGAGEVQIRVNSPSGVAMTGWEYERGSVSTGPWVSAGMTFYLVNRSGQILAQVAPQVTCGGGTGALQFGATDVTDCSNKASRLTWNIPGAGEIQVRVGSPAGTPMTGWEPESGSALTGSWVTNGMVFVIVDRQGRERARTSVKADCGLSPSRFWSEGIPVDAAGWMALVAQQGKLIRRLVLSQQGDWLLLADRNEYHSSGVPADLSGWLRTFRDRGEEIKDVAISPSRGWVILWGRNGFQYSNVASELATKMFEYSALAESLDDVEFSPTGSWTLVFGGNGFWARNVPQGAFDAMVNIQNQKYSIDQAAFGPNGSWAIIFGGNGYSTSGVPAPFLLKLRELNGEGEPISSIALGPNGSWAVISNKRAVSGR
jgi:hypothetical protein